MPSNYDIITRNNEERLGTDTASRKTQLSLYSNPTQFVYEVLQNADNSGATEIFFKLLGDSVVIEHDGSPFTPEDVEGITYFGKGTSRDDFVKGGRFGIGFKSVFAVTATPIIISGNEHFRIHDLYRVGKYPYPNDLLRSHTPFAMPYSDNYSECAEPTSFQRPCTRIILPFNHETEEPDFVEELIAREEAYQQIEQCLSKPDLTTLLSPQSVRKIRWEIYKCSTRYIQKIHRNGEIVHIDTNEQLVKEVVKAHPFRMGTLERMETEQGGIRIKVDGSSGAATQEYLRFEKVVILKNEDDGKPKSCRISIAFGCNWSQRKLTPLEPGQVFIYFPAAKERSGLRFHLQAPFVSNAARDSVRNCPTNDELRDHLAELVAESMQAIRTKGLLDVEFLSILPNSKDDLASFYQPIQERLVEEFNRKHLVPMKQGEHAAASECYRGSKNSKDLSDLIQDEDLAMLLRIRKGEQVSTEIMLRISRYPLLTKAEEQALACAGSAESKKQLIEANLRLVVSIVRKFRGCGIEPDNLFNAGREGLTEAVNEYDLSNGKFSAFKVNYIRRAIQNYIDTNQSSVNILAPPLWIKNPRIGSREDNFLSMLDISEWTIDDFIKVLRFPSQSDTVMNWLMGKRDEWYYELYEFLGHFLSKRPLYQGLKVAHYIISTSKLFLDDTSAVLPKSVAKAKLIWKVMMFLNEQLHLETRTRGDKVDITALYENAVHQLKETGWVPQENGGPTTFVKPREASADYLPKGFPHETGQEWLEAIEFGVIDKKQKQEDKELAEKIDQICKVEGVSRAELIRKFKKSNEEETEDTPSIGRRRKPPFPEQPIAAREKWAAQFAQELGKLSSDEYNRRAEVVQGIVATAYTRAWLMTNYTNDDGQMVCQVCELEMPFKKQDSDYYFEAVRLFTLDELRTEHEAFFLALCPECAARFYEFAQQNPKIIADLINQLMDSESLKISLQLGEVDASLRFVEWHWAAMKNILEN